MERPELNSGYRNDRSKYGNYHEQLFSHFDFESRFFFTVFVDSCYFTLCPIFWCCQCWINELSKKSYFGIILYSKILVFICCCLMVFIIYSLENFQIYERKVGLIWNKSFLNCRTNRWQFQIIIYKARNSYKKWVNWIFQIIEIWNV